MRTTLSKRVRPGLVQFVRNYGYEKRPSTETVWIIEGTETLLEFPHHKRYDDVPHPEYGVYTSPTGINEYGTIKRKGYEHVIVYRISRRDTQRVLALGNGWKEIGWGNAYSYVTQMVPKEGAS